MIKKILITSAAIAAASLIATYAACAAEQINLPEISGWDNGELRVTELDAMSGHKGRWLERSYRTASGVPFRAILMEGSGAKGWELNERQYAGGEVSGGETIEAIMVREHMAVVEYRPIIGYNLIVKIGDAVLNLESQTADKRDLADAADILIKNIDN